MSSRGFRAVPSPPRILDPELAAMHVLMPAIDIADVGAARVIEQNVVAEMQRAGAGRPVEVTQGGCPRPDGSTVPVRIYRPDKLTGRVLPVLLFIHGGSFVSGGLHTEHGRSIAYALQVGCAVVGLDYRLAPEHQFPAGFDDCHTVLTWLYRESASLLIDPGRMAVGGLSAGGALAAGIAERNLDEGGPDLVLQLLLFPVLDARAASRSIKEFDDTPVITAGTMRTMWRMYLGDGWPRSDREPPRYASPAHRANLRGLPPVFLATAEYDPLRDEGLDYARRLLDSDVSVDLRQYAHTFHSFDSFEAARLAQRARQDQVDALRAAFS